MPCPVSKRPVYLVFSRREKTPHHDTLWRVVAFVYSQEDALEFGQAQASDQITAEGAVTGWFVLETDFDAGNALHEVGFVSDDQGKRLMNDPYTYTLPEAA